jgi:hypothetical protein
MGVHGVPALDARWPHYDNLGHYTQEKSDSNLPLAYARFRAANDRQVVAQA